MAARLSRERGVSSCSPLEAQTSSLSSISPYAHRLLWLDNYVIYGVSPVRLRGGAGADAAPDGGEGGKEPTCGAG